MPNRSTLLSQPASWCSGWWNKQMLSRTWLLLIDWLYFLSEQHKIEAYRLKFVARKCAFFLDWTESMILPWQMGQRLSKAHNVKYFWNRLDNRHGQNCDWFICGFCRVAGGQIEVDQIFLACLGRGFFVRWKWTCKLFFGNLLSLFSMSAKKNKLKKSVSTLTSSLM